MLQQLTETSSEGNDAFFGGKLTVGALVLEFSGSLLFRQYSSHIDTGVRMCWGSTTGIDRKGLFDCWGGFAITPNYEVASKVLCIRPPQKQRVE